MSRNVADGYSESEPTRRGVTTGYEWEKERRGEESEPNPKWGPTIALVPAHQPTKQNVNHDPPGMALSQIIHPVLSILVLIT